MPTTSNGWSAADWQAEYEALRADWAHRTGKSITEATNIYWPTDRPPINRTGRTTSHGVS